MKRILLAACVAMLASSAATAGPLAKLADRLRSGHGSFRTAAARVMESRPLATATANVLSVPQRIVEAKPVRTTFGFPGRSGCPGGVCPGK